MIHRINPSLVVSAGASSQSYGTVQFANSNGVSFGLSNGVFTASAVGGGGGAAITLSDPATSLVASQIAFTNLNGLTLGLSTTTGGKVTVTGSYTVPSIVGLISAINVSAGANSSNVSAVVFSNANGVSFGLNGQTVTGSHNGLTTARASNDAVGLNTAKTNVTWAVNSSGLSLDAGGYAGTGFTSTTTAGTAVVGTQNTAGLSLGVPTIITNALTSQSNQAFSAGGGSSAFQTLGFSNMNGVSFTNTNGSVGVAHDLQYTSATSAITSNALNTSASRVFNVVAATNNTGGGTASLSSNVSFSNANGATFYTSAGNAVALSYTVPTVPAQFSGGLTNIGNTSGDTGVVTGRVVFAGGNNITVSGSTNGGSMTLTISGANVGGAQTGISALANSETTFTSGSVTFSALGALTIRSTTGQQFQFSVNAQTNQSLGIYASSNTTLTSSGTADARSLSMRGVGGISVGVSASEFILSVRGDYLTTAMQSNAATISNINVSAGAASNNLSAVVFSNSNNVSFGLNGSTVTGSASFAQTNQSAIKGFGVSNTGQTAGNTGLSTGIDWVLAGSQSITLSQSTAVGGPNTVWIQHPAWLTTADLSANSSKYGQNWKLTGNTAGTTSSAQGTDWWFSGASNVTVSGNSNTIAFSVGNYITTARASNDAVGLNTAKTNVTWTVNSSGISFDAGAYLTSQSNQAFSAVGGSSAFQTLSFSNANGVSFTNTNGQVGASIAPRKVFQIPNVDNPWAQTNFSISNASFSLQPWNPRADITATQANLLMALSGNTNSSGALTISLGIYTMQGSTMSLASSDSRQITWSSGSQTTASSLYGGVSGTQYRTVPLASWAISAGDYMLGVWYRTTNDGTWRAWGQQGPTIVNGLDANETNAYLPGHSTSSFVTAMPASINVTATNFVRTGSGALQHPNMLFLGTF